MTLPTMLRSDCRDPDQRIADARRPVPADPGAQAGCARRCVDPLNKQRVTGQPPKRLTYAQADRAISALAAHFIESGLPANSVIALQLPNTVEFVLTVLAAHRAGLVVALLPLLWRQAELTVALNRTGARAIVTIEPDRWRRSRRYRHERRRRSLFDPPCLRFRQRPAGRHGLARPCPVDRIPPPPRAVVQDGRKAAVVSFDVTPDGFRPVPRTHLNLIAGGLALSLESDVPQGATIMSAFAPSSFAGLTSSLVMWLLSGGTLALHHPFDGDVLEQQIVEHACDTLVAPAQLALRLGEIDLASTAADIAPCDRSLARAGTGRVESRPGVPQHATLTDVYLFGEAGLFGARRTAEDGAPAAILPGPHRRAARSRRARR